MNLLKIKGCIYVEENNEKKIDTIIFNKLYLHLS